MARRTRSAYVPPTSTKVGVKLPTETANYFRKHATREFSDEALGAVVLWLALGPEASPDGQTSFTELRERAHRYGRTMKIEEAVKLLRSEMVDLVTNQLLSDWIQMLPKDERARMLARARGLLQN